MKLISKLIFCLVILQHADTIVAHVMYTGNWRWRNDNGDVYSATFADSLNTPIIKTDYDNIRLRMETIVTVDVPPSTDISIWYTEQPDLGIWIPLTNSDTGKFYISQSQYLIDTAFYDDNELLPPFNNNIGTMTFDKTNNHFIDFQNKTGSFELEYSLKPTSRIQPESAYFFNLSNDGNMMVIGGVSGVDGDFEYPLLLTPPVNWIQQKSGVIEDLTGVFFTDINNGSIVGESGKILKTTDGGTTWNSQSSGTAKYLNDVFFSDINNGTAVGEVGTILHTTNGGTNWTTQSSGTIAELKSVTFTDNNNGTIVGLDGTILKTTNGGSSWITKSINSIYNLFSVNFSDDIRGSIVGLNTVDFSGIILRTTDGGLTWDLQSGIMQYPLSDVYFTSTNIGWAVGWDHNSYYLGTVYAGVILKTTNGGITWLKESNLSMPSLHSVYFVDSNIGWVVSAYGFIFKTIDGGLNWTKLTIPSSQSFNDLYFVNSNTGWIIGYYGKILKTSNGGITSSDEKEPESILNNFYLSQNYPNPFNSTSVIKYSIPKSSQVSLKIFNTLGEEIETLVNEEKPVGTYELNWNAANLPSGVYFYRLQAGSFVQTRKMILLK